jgi:hypothetical protein
MIKPNTLSRTTMPIDSHTKYSQLAIDYSNQTLKRGVWSFSKYEIGSDLIAVVNRVY